MNDDKFKLGNFDGIADDSNLEDLDEPEEYFEETQAKEGSKIAEEVNQDIERIEEKSGFIAKARSLIRHPAQKPQTQAKFGGSGNKRFTEIEISKILPNEFQPRRIFDPEKLQELADSIKEHGIIQPLVVMPREDGRYEIIVGERRYRASKLAGLQKVPVFVSPKLSNQTKLELALIENVQRADLNPIEQAKAYQRLSEEFGLTQKEIGERVGKNHSTVANLMRLLNLPASIQRALATGEIAEGLARPLLALRSHEEMLQMYEMIQKHGLKTRDIESKVQEIKKRKIKVREMFTPDPFLESLENLLRNRFGTRVIVNKKSKGGEIKIEFYSEEELRDIIDKLT